MASEAAGITRRDGTRTTSAAAAAAAVVEEIVPNSGWTDDHSSHFLLVDLPEFRKEEVTLQVDGSDGRIIVKGERQTNEQKRIHFELAFPLPPDSDVDNISGNFDSEILHVHVPKRASHQEHRESGHEIERASNNGSVGRPQEIVSEEHEVVNEGRDHGHYQHEEDRDKKEERRNENAQYMDNGYSKKLTRKLEQKRDMSRALVEVLMRNKGVVTTAVVAFSFGLYVSNKFHSWNEP
ncbi:hypothetical protein AAZX31_06G181500 [Glycine max]|uniref:SHSP domain-containing protein n=2 Tax=Glycine subgen. Soja TaxID=1462606 RepID=K7KVW6_SOYBN|nr:uncharacterized protein LOC100802285 [Glycine max]XP_028237210.1 uncharacterized protein LOC114416519 [Glycine soja]KAG5046324.1 hypothetical protein JHK86_015730 [Glycine max]KAH1126633.1 hypothetical protein GYH30_015576 [Glycine max]KAH1246330.1 Inactive protein RESTRICTED TEV MOVEMENT 2 [Glycine max]KRH54507.1 hypothetical protein GLYMA_06G190600v4 [Glycine max]RZC08269.1 hypothetical protein D0Y65_015131 [Glycine soja]|eukprot:XP_006581955.1 uncharacterized protein LOC100802285 [Glycine max]